MNGDADLGALNQRWERQCAERGIETLAATRERVQQEKSEPPVTYTLGVCGGDPCVRGTRIPVWAWTQLSADEIADGWYYLDRSLIGEVLEWMAKHREEVDALVTRNRAWWDAHDAR